MKKVLIISYYFNQKEMIGSIRLRGLTKYLPKFGWEPTILTIKSDKGSEPYFKTIETKYLDLMANWKSKIGLNPENTVKNQLKIENKKNRKGLINFLLDIWVEIVAYPDAQKNWYKPAVEAGSGLLENEHFDAMLSSSSPVTCHLIANELKRRYEIPWVADLRDLWTQNHYYNFSRFRKFREVRLEKRTLSQVDALSTVSMPWVNKLKSLHKNKKVYDIPNGFDQETESSKNENLDKKFTIIYTGSIYEGKMDPEPLFKALSEMIEDKEIDAKDLLIEFYGTKKESIINSAEKYDLKQILKIHDVVPHDEILKKQSKSQLLLLLDWNDPSEKGVLPGKIFEYLAAKRPIISVGGYDGAVEKLIKQTNAGVCLNDFDKLKCVIRNAYSEFKLYGEVKYKGIPEEIEKYTHFKMAQKFAEVLNEIK